MRSQSIVEAKPCTLGALYTRLPPLTHNSHLPSRASSPFHNIFPLLTTNPSNTATAVQSLFSASWKTKLAGE